MSDERPLWHLVASWTVSNPSTYSTATRCQRCGKVIEPGEVCSEIVRHATALSKPQDPDTRRYVCDACLDRIGDRLTRSTT